MTNLAGGSLLHSSGDVADFTGISMRPVVPGASGNLAALGAKRSRLPRRPRCRYRRMLAVLDAIDARPGGQRKTWPVAAWESRGVVLVDTTGFCPVGQVVRDVDRNLAAWTRWGPRWPSCGYRGGWQGERDAGAGRVGGGVTLSRSPMDADPNVAAMLRFIRIGCATMRVIPPVASSAGEGGQPPGGGHLRVSPVYFIRSREPRPA